MNSTCFTLNRQEDLAYLSIDVPNESLNTLRTEFAPELDDILQHLLSLPDLQGLIIHSAKADCFIAGADIAMLDACTSEAEAQALSSQGHRVFSALEALPFPVVAAIDGVCLGGGLELALACDYRIVTDNVKTRLGLPEVQLGLLPGGGGTQRLPKLLGIQKALELMLTGKHLRAKQALKLGLVDEIVAPSILLQVAEQYLKQGKPARKAHRSWITTALESSTWGRQFLFSQILKRTLAKTQGNYPAPIEIIACVQAYAEQRSSAAYLEEAQRFAKLVLSDESIALRQLFFANAALKKEQPYPHLQAKNNANVGVLGGGLMGAGIAYVTACNAKRSVRIKDIQAQGVSQALAYIYRLLDKKRQRRFISSAQVSQQMSAISGGTDYLGFAQRDIVIEAVFEDLSLKQQMVLEVERYCQADTIFATNTSSLPISSIAAVASRPENVIGLHYFSPVEKMPLVEIIPHSASSEQTICDTLALARAQGKTAIVVKDSAGFYVNRILAPYINEAARLLLEGQSIEHIDQALVAYGFPVGPMTLLDDVGIDVACKISPILEQAFGQRFAAPEAFQRLLDDKRLGKKTARGLYCYAKGKRTKADSSVYRLLGVKLSEPMAPALIAQRCVVLMLNEAARSLDEGVIASEREGDLGAIFGIGFPPFLGGPFSLMRQQGYAELIQELTLLATCHGERYQPAECLSQWLKEQP